MSACNDIGRASVLKLPVDPSDTSKALDILNSYLLRLGPMVECDLASWSDPILPQLVNKPPGIVTMPGDPRVGMCLGV